MEIGAVKAVLNVCAFIIGKETKVSCSVGTRLWRAGGAGGVVWGYIIRLFLRIIHLVVCKCMTEWFGTQ